MFAVWLGVSKVRFRIWPIHLILLSLFKTNASYLHILRRLTMNDREKNDTDTKDT